jgi:HEPN domain-containing protein
VQHKDKREWVRSQLIQARNELETAKRHTYFLCDVCGPYGHTFHVCHSAVAKSVKALLYFHDREPGEIHDLKRLVALAAAVAPGFESCIEYRYRPDSLWPAHRDGLQVQAE